MHIIWADTMTNLVGLGGGKKITLMQCKKPGLEENIEGVE